MSGVYGVDFDGPPDPINYNGRSIFENILDPGAWGNLLNQVTPMIESGADLYKSVKDAMDAVDTETEKVIDHPSNVPAYNPNVSAADFAFQPYWYLFGAGALLLIIVLIIKR